MIVKRAPGAAIVLFWCVMNTLLIMRQLESPPPPVTIQPAVAITEPTSEWWGITYRGEKIGYAAQEVTPTPTGYLLRGSSMLRLNLLGTVQSVSTRQRMEATSDWTLKEFDFEMESAGVRFKASGVFSQGRLQLEVDSGGHLAEKEIPLRRPPYLSATLRHFIATQNLEPGKQHLFSTFDPSTLSQQITTVTVEGREMIEVGETPQPAIRIRQRVRGISVVAWIDGEGRTLREESPGGFAMISLRPAEAKSLEATPAVSLDLIAETAIPTDTLIADPGQKRFLKLELSGFDPSRFSLDSGRQRLTKDILVVRREDLSQLRSYRIPMEGSRFASYLQPTPFLQSDHPRIRSLAQEVLEGETDALKAVARLRTWVYNGLRKEPTVSIPNALEVLQTRKGDCNEHTVLFNAMARAAGIPTKTVVGVVYLRGAFYYHAWSEVWLARWVTVDSVLNQFPADVTHIKFLEGEIDRQIDLLELIGKLKVRLLEVS